jgi:hypothetical protein
VRRRNAAQQVNDCFAPEAADQNGRLGEISSQPDFWRAISNTGPDRLSGESSTATHQSPEGLAMKAIGIRLQWRELPNIVAFRH